MVSVSTSSTEICKAVDGGCFLQTASAVERLRELASGGGPSLLKIGVRAKGCAGMAYHLEYVDQAARFDDVVEQDGVRVIIDSRALMSIIGSEMDWVEDKLR